MNIKKVGLTALAASLVSVSAHAGAVSVAGGASMNMEGHTGEGLNAGTTFSMSNQLTFTGSGELDNGLNVSISFVLDQGDNANTTAGAAEAPFDSHSVTVSSDSLGSLTLAGEGGNSATTRIDFVTYKEVPKTSISAIRLERIWHEDNDDHHDH